MSDTFYIKQHDTSPAIGGICLDGAGAVVNVTGASVVFSMRRRAGEVLVNRAVGAVVLGVAGTVKYEWIAANTAITGLFEGEFELTYPSGAIETFPNNGYISIRVGDDIA